MHALFFLRGEVRRCTALGSFLILAKMRLHVFERFTGNDGGERIENLCHPVIFFVQSPVGESKIMRYGTSYARVSEIVSNLVA